MSEDRTDKTPVTMLILAKFPMMFQDKACMPQALYQRTDFYIPFFGIPANRLHFLFAYSVWCPDFGAPGIAQLIFQFPDNCIYLVSGHFINYPIIIFCTVEMMFRVKMYSPVCYFRIINDSQLGDGGMRIPAIFHQLL